MPRARMRWFKVSTSILYSSMNYELTLEEQAAFLKTLALCAELGGTGVIADGEGQSMPHDFIASRVHVPVDIFDSMLVKCIATNRISENSAGIIINKWNEYQSEYQRQKPYRQGKLGLNREGRELSPEGKYGNEFAIEITKYKAKHDGKKPEGKELMAIEAKVRKRIYGDGR